MKVSTPTPPPAPAPVSAGDSMRSYLEAVSDPALQQQLLEAEQTYRPQYAALNLADLQTYLAGTENQTGATALYTDLIQNLGQAERDNLSKQRAQDITDVENLGLRASQAFQNANPQLKAAIDRAGGLLSTGGPVDDFEAYVRNNPDLLKNWEDNVSKNTGMSLAEYGKQHYEQSGKGEGRQLPTRTQGDIFADLESVIKSTPKRGDIERGVLGQSIYDQAVAAQGLGNVGGLLQGRAEELAQSRGRLTADELRNSQQAIREAYASRGVELGSGAVSAEALSRLSNERQRMQEDLAMAQALNAGNLAEIGQNRAYQQSAYGQDLARQEGNRTFGLGQDQQTIANYGLLGQLRQGQQAQDRGYALQLAGLQQSTAVDPLMAILGRSSQALGAAQGQQGFAAGMMQNQGPQLFDPNAGVNLALQNNANLANYNAATYGAQAAASGAQTGGLLGAFGQIGGAMFGGGGLFGK